MPRKYLIVDGCPCPASIAPYIHTILRDAGQQANSIYRGEDAAGLLHRYGKHTQGELYRSLPLGLANPPGRSTHELRSDDVAYFGPIGRPLADWQVGVDSGTDAPLAKARIVRAAERHGWKVKHPYTAGVEGHHWNFAVQPRPKNLAQRARLIALRARLHRR